MKQGEVITGQIDDGAILLRECSNAPATQPIPHVTIMHPHRYDENGKETVRANSMVISGFGVEQLYKFLHAYYTAK